MMRKNHKRNQTGSQLAHCDNGVLYVQTQNWGGQLVSPKANYMPLYSVMNASTIPDAINKNP